MNNEKNENEEKEYWDKVLKKSWLEQRKKLEELPKITKEESIFSLLLFC